MEIQNYLTKEPLEILDLFINLGIKSQEISSHSVLGLIRNEEICRLCQNDMTFTSKITDGRKEFKGSWRCYRCNTKANLFSGGILSGTKISMKTFYVLAILFSK